MCHMVADSIGELHEMAEVLGVRRWFQSNSRYPHYDISKTKRREAVALGAVECTERKIVGVVREYR